jgi:medium-chain acyl-[acyl-carrier-protein] hydrolase
MSGEEMSQANEVTRSTATQQTWVAYHIARPEAPLRLLCLHYAGGGASLFRHWDPAFAPLAEIYPLQLPGREGRLREPAISTLRSVVARVTDALEPDLERPYAIFGHSMGALIGFELAREVRRRGLAMPVHLFLASYCAPQLLRREHRASTVKQEAARQLAAASAVSTGMTEEMLALFVPTIEADTLLCESYEYVEEEPLVCPITVFRGNTDYVLDEHLAGWRSHTRGAFHAQTFLGDHFFVRHTPRGMVQAIRRALAKHAPGPAR